MRSISGGVLRHRSHLCAGLVATLALAVGLGPAAASVDAAPVSPSSANAASVNAHRDVTAGTAAPIAPAPTSRALAWPTSSTHHLFGLSPSDGGAGASQAQWAGTALKRKVNFVNFYAGWAYPGFDTTALNAIRAIGAVPEITWEPWDYRKGLDQPRYSLSRIIDGDYDSYIRSWAVAAAAWKHPLMLRFAQEMNGSWYPWDTGVNGNHAGQYVEAYRHVHRIFDAVGASNVVWVWSPNTVTSHGPSLKSLYPGASYVDWIGVDGYNAGSALAGHGGWRTPGEIFATTFAAIHQLAPSKPVMVAETASAESGGSKATWINELFTLLDHYPQVRAVCWFDYDKEANWTFNSSLASEKSMQTSLAARWHRG